MELVTVQVASGAAGFVVVESACAILANSEAAKTTQGKICLMKSVV